MPTDLAQIGINCIFAFASFIALVFMIDWLGFYAWVWWASRERHQNQDSCAKRYWSAHE
jgi:cbb3-type cytochrome oxidase subunit 3